MASSPSDRLVATDAEGADLASQQYVAGVDAYDGWTMVVDWRDGSNADAIAAIREVLTTRGIGMDDVDPKDIRIESGSRRVGQPASPYFRAWVKESVLGSERDE